MLNRSALRYSNLKGMLCVLQGHLYVQLGVESIHLLMGCVYRVNTRTWTSVGRWYVADSPWVLVGAKVKRGSRQIAFYLMPRACLHVHSVCRCAHLIRGVCSEVTIAMTQQCCTAGVQGDVQRPQRTAHQKTCSSVHLRTPAAGLRSYPLKWGLTQDKSGAYYYVAHKRAQVCPLLSCTTHQAGTLPCHVVGLSAKCRLSYLDCCATEIVAVATSRYHITDCADA